MSRSAEGGTPPPREPDHDLLPQRSRDEQGAGWGDREVDGEDELLREVPPHHGA